MSVIEIVSLALVGLFLLVAVVRLFRKPLKLALRPLESVSFMPMTLPVSE